MPIPRLSISAARQSIHSDARWVLLLQLLSLAEADRVTVTGLVTRFHKPVPANPRTRETVPSGYGVREQCLPFTAAAALGFFIPSPISWGFCKRGQVPSGARAFRSPVGGGCPKRCFYVIDDPALDFVRNQFAVPPKIRARIGPGPVPGLSFFERPDQQSMIKLHLPYIWRTPPGIDMFFTAPVNRPRKDDLVPLNGLVECDWYADMVNLVLLLPPAPTEVHVKAGQTIAQAVPMQRELRQMAIEIQSSQQDARHLFDGVADWRNRHDTDRSAYKRLAKSRSGRIPDLTD